MAGIAAPCAGGSRSRLPGFFRDRSGAAAVEFALVSIPFLALIFMIFQVALFHFGLQSLDHASRQAARQIMIGDVPNTIQSAAAFKDEVICPNVIFGLLCNNLIVSVYKVDPVSNESARTGIYEFVDPQSKSLKAPSASPTFCLGGPSDYIFLDLAYDFPSFMGSLMSNKDSGPRKFMLRSTNFFRNEPYRAAGQPC